MDAKVVKKMGADCVDLSLNLMIVLLVVSREIIYGLTSLGSCLIFLARVWSLSRWQPVCRAYVTAVFVRCSLGPRAFA